MIEVVFNETIKASMKHAKKYNKETNIHGNPEDVILISSDLDIGDISGDLQGIERREVFDKLWIDIYPDEKDRTKYFNNQYKDIEKLLEIANKGKVIRIWKGNSPSSVCAFAFLCNLLEDLDCMIKVVNLPQYILRDDGIIESFVEWDSVAPKEFYKYLSYEKDLSHMEKIMYSGIWQELKLENAPLRAIVNGYLISVPEDFYDHLIIKNIPQGEFKMVELVGAVFGRYQIGVSDFWYVQRIKNMIQEGLLEVVFEKQPSWKYETVLRKKE